MADPQIAQKSPYVLNIEPGTYYWCQCGRSSNQPFCDGSHNGTDFTPVEFTIDSKSTVALCGCKHTKTPPFCDGSHNDV
ncbi:MAG: CDGSH iron-sulfur domain-containing protein [Gammaproteobacteria bacterium]